jgi:hypothetical protein
MKNEVPNNFTGTQLRETNCQRYHQNGTSFPQRNVATKKKTQRQLFGQESIDENERPNV